MAKQKEQTQKKERTERQAKNSFVKLCAFVALILAAVLLVIGPILGKLVSALIMNILNMLASYSLLVAIALPAWDFVRGKKKGWKIAYWIALAVYIVGAILGVALAI